MDLAKTSWEFKKDLAIYFGNRFSKLILFGSYARKDFSAESDLDYLLVLKDKDMNLFREIAAVTPVLDTFLLKYGKVFSLTATSEEKYAMFSSPFFQAVRNEVIEIV